MTPDRVDPQSSTAPSAEPPPRTIRDRLGPILIVSPLRRPVVGRFWAAAIAITCSGILGFAATLHASPTGYGTHTQLGFGQCGFLLTTGYPCPTCGMTTAFADLAHGHLLRSIWDQPMGFLLALTTAIIAVVALTAAIIGRVVRINWYRVNPVRVVWGFVVVFLGSWGFKTIVILACGTPRAK